MAGRTDGSPTREGRQQREAAAAALGNRPVRGCRYSLSVGRGPRGERLYRCRAKHASGTCPEAASVMADTVESYVEGLVLSEIDGFTRLVPDSAERDRAERGARPARDLLDGFRATALPGASSVPTGTMARRLSPGGSGCRSQARSSSTLGSGAAMSGLTRDHYLALSPADRREVLGGFIDTVMVRRSRGRGRNVDPIDRPCPHSLARAGSGRPSPAAGRQRDRPVRLREMTSNPGWLRRRTARRASSPARRAAGGIALMPPPIRCKGVGRDCRRPPARMRAAATHVVKILCPRRVRRRKLLLRASKRPTGLVGLGE